MKQKILIKVSMHCRQCYKIAMKIASVAEGVTSVALHGPETDKLMIIGDGVDAAKLTEALRKKLSYASIENVEEIKPTNQNSNTNQNQNTNTNTNTNPVIHCPNHASSNIGIYHVVPLPDHSSPSFCTIL